MHALAHGPGVRNGRGVPGFEVLIERKRGRPTIDV